MSRLDLKISHRIAEKLKQKHNVNIDEIGECFLNRTKGLLTDTRLNNRTEPATLWFIARTDFGRNLKIVFIKHYDGTYEIKTAYEPNETEMKIYDKNA